MEYKKSWKVGAAVVAAAIVAPCAYGQSAVTLAGVIDAAVSHNQGTGRGSVTGLSSGNNLASRIIFRGTEDLGGGLGAGFWLEGQLNMDNGNAAGLTFTRRSTVSLTGNFGEVRLGRDLTPTYLNDWPYDPFQNRGAGTALNYNNFSGTVGGVATGIDELRVNNSIGYFTPAILGGWNATAQYAFGEAQSTAVNNKGGNYLGARVSYAQGPVNFGVAAGKWRQVGNAASAVNVRGDLEKFSVGGSYDFGIVRPMAYYGQEKLTGFLPATLTTMLIGAVVPIGAGEFRFAYSHYDLKNSANDFNKFAIGYNYNLSKRTQLYATVAKIQNKGAATKSIGQEGLAATGTSPGGSSSGFDLGIRHLF